MGCSNTTGTKTNEFTTPNIQNVEYNTINIKFKLSTGQQYEINAKEDEVFENVLDKFKTEHSDLNIKILNVICQNNNIDIHKTILENNIKENNLIEIDIEEPELEHKSEEDNDLYIEYNPENIIWIDENVDNDENTGYLKDLNSLGYKVECFKNVDDGLNYIKSIKFESTKIIISGRLYIKFIKIFIDNLNDIYVIPKIIIFTRNKEGFIKSNKANEDLINHPFFNYGGIRVIISDVIRFLKDEIIQTRVKKKRTDENQNLENNEFLDKRLKTKDNAKLTFEYIDSNQKLTLPLFYKILIDSIKIHDIEEYTDLLYSKYAEDNGDLKELLTPIKSIYDVPIELLSKYYTRLYTIESCFYKDINKDLRENKTVGYLPYIKILYEGVKLQSLRIASDLELYRGSKISYDEIEKIKGYLDKKITNLPGAIVFSKSFLSFSKERSIAIDFLHSGYMDSNLRRVLYIIEKDKDIDYSLSTHTDIENISIFNNEKEVLFFPFSPFEIKTINEIGDNGETIYEIRLLYLGKYLKEIEKDVNIVEMENEIPDSEFKKQILELGLIDKNKVNNTKELFNNFKLFQNNIKNNGFKKFVVKDNINSLYDSYNDNLKENKINRLAQSYNKNSTFIKNKLNQSQLLLKKKKTLSFDDKFNITLMEDENYKVKIIDINVTNFFGEHLIPIWFEKEKYIKFNTTGNYRINQNSQFHNTFGILSSMNFNYGATIARIGSGEPFVLPSNDFVYISKTEGPLYLKIKYPNNIELKPEGKLKIKIFDGELMTMDEIYDKIGWKVKNLKYANKKATLTENELTVFLNNLRMNPKLFYESFIKDDNDKKIFSKEFLENMAKNNDKNGITPFTANNELYDHIRDYVETKYDSISKTLKKKNSIEYLKKLQEFLDIYLKEKIDIDIILNCKLIKKAEIKHICLQYLYDKTFIPKIFEKEYNSIAIHIREDFFNDFYLIILAITKVEIDNNEN